MKKYLSILILLPLLSFGQIKSDALFEKFEDYKDVTSILITEHMFALADSFIVNLAKNDTSLAPIKELLPKMRAMKILVYDGKPKKSPFNTDIKKALKKNYKTLMKVKSSESNVDFLMDGEGENINELVLLTDNAYIFLEGDLTMDDVNTMVEKFNK